VAIFRGRLVAGRPAGRSERSFFDVCARRREKQKEKDYDQDEDYEHEQE